MSTLHFEIYSAHALPVAFKGLMSDEDSSIIDFYPSGESS